ncbi:metallophosphoesterase family protein [Azomonas agilis]|uniref:metallophosphoesterase family protein n=1 Tax=Azomonas agilis TaxID=116849 RepID=UPI00147889A8
MPDAIIVSGDIAFAGAPDEFAFATEWLTKLCEACRCSLESVFVVPGNHDVVRERAGRNLVQLIYRQIKQSDTRSLRFQINWETQMQDAYFMKDWIITINLRCSFSATYCHPKGHELRATSNSMTDKKYSNWFSENPNSNIFINY